MMHVQVPVPSPAWPVEAESYHYFIEALCENIPEEWDDDVAAEAIILNYVRHLESLVPPRARLLEQTDRTTPVDPLAELLRVGAVNRELRAEVETWRATAIQADKLRYEAANALNAALAQNGRFAADLQRLRGLIDKHNDECRECPVID